MKTILFLLAFCIFVFLLPLRVFAVYDPESRPNNIFGIHILFPQEIEYAAKIVNGNGGNWGYVTIPIQYQDRNIEKWQQFMNDAAKFHVIPIIRLATNAYYKNTGVWRKPEYSDILDFANFLDSLTWPVKNRYVVLFNEVNRFDEWGGDAPNPEEYADLVSYAEEVFKQRSPDFFLITAGLDNAAPNDGGRYMDNLVYLRRMGLANASVFSKIDGIASHSYPNPDFSQPPLFTSLEGTSTYKFEENIVSYYSVDAKPVFVTETGWNSEKLPESVISSYFTTAMSRIWGEDKKVVAVTPFVLNSQNGGYDKLSFTKNNELTGYGKTYAYLAKVSGDPILNKMNLNSVEKDIEPKNEKVTFSNLPLSVNLTSNLLKNYMKAIFAVGK